MEKEEKEVAVQDESGREAELETARQALREVDEQMAALFVKRMEAVRAVAEFKRDRGLPIEGKDQEARVIERNGALIDDDELRSYYLQFQQATMDVSKRWQHRLMDGQRVAYSGVEGAFAHIAAKRIFPDGTSVPYASFEDAYNAVVVGECDLAVLPIENSRAGEVAQVLDLMFAGPLFVNGVYSLPVVQNLLGVPGSTLEDVRTVISHPQALAQCSAYIRAHGFETQSAPNTAIAAQQVAEAGNPSIAAIASDQTASLYGLSVLDHDINEDKSNITRFAVFSRVESTVEQKGEKGAFILLFTVRDEAGGLAKAINIISAYDFNMKVLRSRPMQDLPWHYYFYVEADGSDMSQEGQRMLNALRGACPTVKIAGRYRTFDSAIEGEGEQ
ncbi:MAG: chorismate mutase [Eggerthellaceae bacterium]|nr:chorismate mutase [Eggerthellaceae bacterium]